MSDESKTSFEWPSTTWSVCFDCAGTHFYVGGNATIGAYSIESSQHMYSISDAQLGNSIHSLICVGEYLIGGALSTLFTVQVLL